MKIGLDFTSVLYGRGVSRYTANLARALLNVPEVSLQLFGSSLRQYAELSAQAKQLGLTDSQLKQQTHFLHYPPSMLAKLWRLNLLSIQNLMPKIDVFHSWDWLQPPDKNLPLVSTIHDLSMLKYPDTAHPGILKAHERSWKILKEREAEIIAVSEATKKDIMAFLDIPSYKIHVVPEALPWEVQQVNEALTEEETERIKENLPMGQPYLLFVGTREPRKNLLKLIEAWEPLQNEVSLLIAGSAGWDDTDQQPHHANLHFLGRVSDQQLNVLYAEAEAFVFPSLDEGFGLPILEAFYHGTPVITSNVPALVEVAGNAAELADPESAEDIRRAIGVVLGENGDKQRQRLQRMIIRLHMFSWHQVAQQTLEVYSKAVSNHE